MTHDQNSSVDIKPHLVRVLIVDDNPQVRQDLSRLLGLSGVIEVVGEAEDGLDAVRQAASLCPEVVVMDLEMPDLNGYEATARIKSEQPNLRIVILSVHVGSNEIERAQSAGADDFVGKGADCQTILNAILGKGGETNSFQKGENS